MIGTSDGSIAARLFVSAIDIASASLVVPPPSDVVASFAADANVVIVVVGHEAPLATRCDDSHTSLDGTHLSPQN